jgi:hypothetical protein
MFIDYKGNKNLGVSIPDLTIQTTDKQEIKGINRIVDKLIATLSLTVWTEVSCMCGLSSGNPIMTSENLSILNDYWEIQATKEHWRHIIFRGYCTKVLAVILRMRGFFRDGSDEEWLNACVNSDLLQHTMAVYATSHRQSADYLTFLATQRILYVNSVNTLNGDLTDLQKLIYSEHSIDSPDGRSFVRANELAFDDVQKTVDVDADLVQRIIPYVFGRGWFQGVLTPVHLGQYAMTQKKVGTRSWKKAPRRDDTEQEKVVKHKTTEALITTDTISKLENHTIGNI